MKINGREKLEGEGEGKDKFIIDKKCPKIMDLVSGKRLVVIEVRLYQSDKEFSIKHLKN